MARVAGPYPYSEDDDGEMQPRLGLVQASGPDFLLLGFCFRCCLRLSRLRGMSRNLDFGTNIRSSGGRLRKMFLKILLPSCDNPLKATDGHTPSRGRTYCPRACCRVLSPCIICVSIVGTPSYAEIRILSAKNVHLNVSTIVNNCGRVFLANRTENRIGIDPLLTASGLQSSRTWPP